MTGRKQQNRTMEDRSYKLSILSPSVFLCLLLAGHSCVQPRDGWCCVKWQVNVYCAAQVYRSRLQFSGHFGAIDFPHQSTLSCSLLSHFYFYSCFLLPTRASNSYVAALQPQGKGGRRRRRLLWRTIIQLGGSFTNYSNISTTKRRIIGWTRPRPSTTHPRSF